MKNKEILAQIEKIKAEIEQRREENEDAEEKKKKEGWTDEEFKQAMKFARWDFQLQLLDQHSR